jgi:hypothetical protein
MLNVKDREGLDLRERETERGRKEVGESEEMEETTNPRQSWEWWVGNAEAILYLRAEVI